MHIDEDELVMAIGAIVCIALIYSLILSGWSAGTTLSGIRQDGRFEYNEIIYKVTIDTTATDSLREWRKK